VWCYNGGMNDLSPFDDDEHEAKEVIKLWLEGASEGDVAKRLKLRVVDVCRILDDVAARVLSPASLKRQTARDILSLDKLESDWLPSAGTNIQAALLITKIKEQRRIASGTHQPMRIDLTADVRPAEVGREKIVSLVDRLLAADPVRKMNGGEGYNDERDDEDERLLALKSGE
jgi:hypothetical protein